MNELVLSLVTAAFAWWCAMDDAEAIAEGRKIRHGLQWCMRAAWVLLWCGLFDAWLLAVPLAFLFSGVFRVCLNSLRGKDVRYIAPWSNYYDRTVMSVTVAVRYARHHTLWWWPNDREVGQWKDGYLSGWKWAKDDVHRAGTIAYIFEAVAYGVGLWLWYV